MHPVLAVFLTGLLVTAAYSTAQQNFHPATRESLVAAGDAASPATRIQIQESLLQPFNVKGAVDQNTANQQCPPSGDYYVYTDKQDWDRKFELNKKEYYNLYGKACKAPMIEAFCTGPNKCDGKVPGTKCEIEGTLTRCKLPTIEVADKDNFPNPFRTGRLEQIHSNTPVPEINTVSQNSAKITNEAFGQSQPLPQPQKVVAAQQPQSALDKIAGSGSNSPPPPNIQTAQQNPANLPSAQTPAAKIQAAVAPTPPPTQALTGTKITPQNPVGPSAQNTFQNPTTKLATAQTQVAGPGANTPSGSTQKIGTVTANTNTGAGANPGSGSTIKTASGATTGAGAAPSASSGVKTGSAATPGSGASGSGTPAPAAKPNLSTSIRNAFQGGLNATQIVNGVVNLVSTVISGGSRSSTQSVAQAVDNGARAANTQGSNRVASPIIVEGGVGSQTTPPGQNREASAPVSSFIIPGNAPVLLSSGIEVAELLSLSGESFSFPDDVTDPSAPASNTETSSDQGIADLLNTPAASNEIPGPRIVNAQTPGGAITIMRAGEQFVLNPNLAPENQVIAQNSFAPLPQPERSRSVVQVFHTVSIPNILETISRGSVDFILQLLKRDSPKDTIVYTEWEQDSVVPVPSNAAPLLPDATRTNTTTIGGQVTQTAREQSGSARNTERVAYEERLREAPVAVFAQASAAHSGGTHVPMVNRAFVFDSLLPVPEVSIDIEQPATEPGPIGTVLRVLFPWFFGEMR